MPDFVESLRNIKKDCSAVFISFYIIVYSFNNSIYMFYGCMLTSKTKLMIGNQLMPLYYYEELGSRSFLNSLNRIGSKRIGLYDSASSADLLGFCIIIICATFYWGGKNSRLRTALHN
jgi:hypothetical protein